jgi:hypothetical protein
MVPVFARVKNFKEQFAKHQRILGGWKEEQGGEVVCEGLR